MTREERVKYCQCCLKRRNSTSSGLVCSLTGAQATFEEGCEDFEEDPVAMKEHFYAEEEKKNSRYATIENLIVGLAICCFVIPYTISVAGVAMEGDYSLFGRMLGVTASFAAIGVVMILILYLSRRFKKPKHKTELTDDEMFRIIREEGYFPKKVSDGDIVFRSHDMAFSFGKCADGFVYARLYYRMKEEDRWLALQAAQYTEVSFVAIKVLLVPHKETLLFSVESLCNDPELFRAFIGRAMTILADSAVRYHKRMKELQEDADVCEGDCEDTDSDKVSKLSKMFPLKMLPS